MTDTVTPEAGPGAEFHGHSGRSRGRMTVLGVLGELLITAGALVLLFLAWQLWWNDMVMADSQSRAASEISRQWMGQNPHGTSLDPTPEESAAPVGDPVVAAAPDAGRPLAVLYVPRFGADYHRTIAEGVGTTVLNSTQLGIGHYPGTQMPGEVGNFAIAAHRSAYGGGMHLINELRVGDPIYIQTPDGYYTYRFRNFNYVEATAVDAIDAVPGAPGTTPTDRMITLTSCNPLYSTAERIVAYGIFDSWQPTSAGAPGGLVPIIRAQAKG